MLNTDHRHASCVLYIVFRRFGTQGRLLQWQPDRDVSDKKALLASHPDLQARFLRESALRKESLLADIDFLDVTIRSEIMPSVQGAPAMMQLPLIPCYALTGDGDKQRIVTPCVRTVHRWLFCCTMTYSGGYC